MILLAVNLSMECVGMTLTARRGDVNTSIRNKLIVVEEKKIKWKNSLDFKKPIDYIASRTRCVKRPIASYYIPKPLLISPQHSTIFYIWDQSHLMYQPNHITTLVITIIFHINNIHHIIQYKFPTFMSHITAGLIYSLTLLSLSKKK